MQKAFSLVELSIVLVILGLLTGGILSGQSLIRASQLRSVSSDFQKYTTAMQTFRDKYFSYPGDMPNAVAFWGRHPTTTNDRCTLEWNVAETTAWNNDVARRETCNGNGDGVYAHWTRSEQIVAWQHLSNSGLVEGQYKGGRTGGSGSTTLVPGIHLPPSKLGQVQPTTNHFGGPTAMVFAITPITTGTAGMSYTPRTNAEIEGILTSERNIVYGGLVGPGSHNYVTLGMRPEDAWNVDLKMDDGKPSAGRLLAPTIIDGQPRCATNNTEQNEYQVTNRNGDCHLILRNAF
jgi:prepilin-type N-terminal cleavage/methylation domain-containing protein